MMQPFQILALSGGGFRGLFTAEVLAGLESKVGVPIGRCFDLICGTSIGAIIAMGLGVGKSGREIAEVIKSNGKRIFHGRKKLFSAKHGNKNLRDVVDNIFGEKVLADSENRTLIPVVNGSTGMSRVFKSWDHPGFYIHHTLKMTDVAMAASAAPGYFPAWQMAETREIYLDGGLVANAPGLLGVHEAVHRLENDIHQVRLLSVGTMSPSQGIGDTRHLNRGICGWGLELVDIAMSAQEHLFKSMLCQQLGEDRYHLIEQPPSPRQSQHLGMDAYSEDAMNILCAGAQHQVQCFLGSPYAEWLNHKSSFITKGKTNEH